MTGAAVAPVRDRSSVIRANSRDNRRVDAPPFGLAVSGVVAVRATREWPSGNADARDSAVASRVALRLKRHSTRQWSWRHYVSTSRRGDIMSHGNEQNGSDIKGR